MKVVSIISYFIVFYTTSSNISKNNKFCNSEDFLNNSKPPFNIFGSSTPEHVVKERSLDCQDHNLSDQNIVESMPSRISVSEIVKRKEKMISGNSQRSIESSLSKIKNKNPVFTKEKGSKNTLDSFKVDIDPYFQEKPRKFDASREEKRSENKQEIFQVDLDPNFQEKSSEFAKNHDKLDSNNKFFDKNIKKPSLSNHVHELLNKFKLFIVDELKNLLRERLKITASDILFSQSFLPNYSVHTYTFTIKSMNSAHEEIENELSKAVHSNLSKSVSIFDKKITEFMVDSGHYGCIKFKNLNMPYLKSKIVEKSGIMNFSLTLNYIIYTDENKNFSGIKNLSKIFTEDKDHEEEYSSSSEALIKKDTTSYIFEKNGLDWVLQNRKKDYEKTKIKPIERILTDKSYFRSLKGCLRTHKISIAEKNNKIILCQEDKFKSKDDGVLCNDSKIFEKLTLEYENSENTTSSLLDDLDIKKKKSKNIINSDNKTKNPGPFNNVGNIEGFLLNHKNDISPNGFEIEDVKKINNIKNGDLILSGFATTESEEEYLENDKYFELCSLNSEVKDNNDSDLYCSENLQQVDRLVENPNKKNAANLYQNGENNTRILLKIPNSELLDLYNGISIETTESYEGEEFWDCRSSSTEYLSFEEE